MKSERHSLVRAAVRLVVVLALLTLLRDRIIGSHERDMGIR